MLHLTRNFSSLFGMEVSKMTFQFISLEIQRKLAAFFILVRSYFEKSVRNLLILLRDLL